METKNTIDNVKKIIENAGLYIAKKEDLDYLSEIAADAYKFYPLHNWLMSNKYNAKKSKQIMLISLKTMLNDIIIYADSKEMNGFAVWVPYDFKGIKASKFLFNGGLKLLLTTNPKMFVRLSRYESYAMKVKKEVINEPHWYAYNLCVKQDMQGKGISDKLFNPMMDYFDQENITAYLETNNFSNLEVYDRFGFEPKSESLIPGSNIKHYGMVRKPKNLK